MPHGAVAFPFGACKICSDTATGVHYGVETCEGCKGFFKRSICKADKYKCYFGGQCVISPQNRNRCKSCRWKRCLATGMSIEAIKMGRIPKLDKERALQEIKNKDIPMDRIAGENASMPSQWTIPASKTSNTVPLHHPDGQHLLPSYGTNPDTSLSNPKLPSFPNCSQLSGSQTTSNIHHRQNSFSVIPTVSLPESGYLPESHQTQLKSNMGWMEMKYPDAVTENGPRTAHTGNWPSHPPDLPPASSTSAGTTSNPVWNSWSEGTSEDFEMVSYSPSTQATEGKNHDESLESDDCVQVMPAKVASPTGVYSKDVISELMLRVLKVSQDNPRGPNNVVQSIINKCAHALDYKIESNDDLSTQDKLSNISSSLEMSTEERNEIKEEFEQYLCQQDRQESNDSKKTNHTPVISTDPLFPTGTGQPSCSIHKQEDIAKVLEKAFHDSFYSVCELGMKLEEQKNLDEIDRIDLPLTKGNAYKMWEALFTSIGICNTRILNFSKAVPGFTSLMTCDQEILLKSAYFELWLISVSKIIRGGRSFIPIVSEPCVGATYSENWMQTFLPPELYKGIMNFCETLNSYKLNIMELGLLSAVILTGERSGLSGAESVTKLHNMFVDILAYVVTRQHGFHGAQTLMNIFRLLPQLKAVDELQRSVVYNFTPGTPPGLEKCMDDPPDVTTMTI